MTCYDSLVKILLTGLPKSGKSTLLSELVDGISPRRGFVTKELVKDQHRIGFVVEGMNGRSAVLAQTQYPTSLQVGRFYVHPEVLAEFIKNLSHSKFGEFLYIDEIGQMQLYANEFRALVEEYIDAPNDFIATITSVYSDQFTDYLLSLDNVLYFQLTDIARNEVRSSLKIALDNRNSFNKLPLMLQRVVVGYANTYLKDESFISFGKLFSNAIRYYLGNRVSSDTTDIYLVRGDTNKHKVHFKSSRNWICDCPLSNGTDSYDTPADCSHIQAVRLYRADQRHNIL